MRIACLRIFACLKFPSKKRWRKDSSRDRYFRKRRPTKRSRAWPASTHDASWRVNTNRGVLNGFCCAAKPEMLNMLSPPTGRTRCAAQCCRWHYASETGIVRIVDTSRYIVESQDEQNFGTTGSHCYFLGSHTILKHSSNMYHVLTEAFPSLSFTFLKLGSLALVFVQHHL